MTTNIIYNSKKFEISGHRVICTLTSTFNLDSSPELRALLTTKRAKKMLVDKHCEETTDNNIMFTTIGEAKFNPEDGVFNENIGRHISEDRAMEKAMQKVLFIYKWFMMYIMNIKFCTSERIDTMDSVVTKMQQHNENAKYDPR